MKTDKIKRCQVNKGKNDNAYRNCFIALFMYGHYEKRLNCKCKAFYLSFVSPRRPQRMQRKQSLAFLLFVPLVFFVRDNFYFMNKMMHSHTKGVANNNESNRSKKPPWPGMIWPLSLTPAMRFSLLSIRSPKVPVIDATPAIAIN